MEPLTISFSPLLLSLTVASAAIWIRCDIHEEIVRVFTTAIALVSLLLAFSFTPWFILLIFVGLLLCLKIPSLDKSIR